MTPTVTKIKKLVAAIRAALAGIEIPERLVDHKFGNEEEYTCASIIAHIEANINYVDSVVNDDTVVHIPHSGRASVISRLAEINKSIASKDWEAMWQALDNLKKVHQFLTPILYLDKEKMGADLSELLAKKTKLVADAKIVEQRVGSLTKILEFAEQQKKELDSGITSANQAVLTLKNGVSKTTTNVNVIAQHKSTVEQHAAFVRDHHAKASETEEKLSQQSGKVEELLKKTTKLLNETQGLLGNAVVLGVSSSFLSRYDSAKKENKWPGVFWMGFSALFIMAAIGLNIYWFVADEPVKTVYELLSRISVTSLLVAGAWFCAGQYTKRKNIVEDYAYKAMLANSLVGLSEQLKDKDGAPTESYKEYMQTVLHEIHQHPLKNHKKMDSSAPYAELVKAMEKALKGAKEN